MSDVQYIWTQSQGLQDKFYNTAFGPRGQAGTSLTIEDLRSNKTTFKLS